MKIFKEEIKKIFDKLQSREYFAFSKYADGEWSAILGKKQLAGNGEWITNDDSDLYALPRYKLINSFRYKDPNYFVGISCTCCRGEDHYRMKEFCGQDEENLTFANIFVNANYQFYLDNFIPEYKNRDIYLIANKKTILSNLPFKVEKFFPIKYNAWLLNLNLIEELKNQEYKDKLFLFSAGPFGNILSAELWQHNKNNTYLDIGSTIDPWTKAEKIYNKYYYDKSPYKNKVCIWQ